ncbi:hypothetical protein Tco_0405123 [Tanacetum coccineum]
MEIDSESKIIVSEEGQSAMQTEATTSSGTNVKPSTLLLVYLMFKRFMEKLQIDKSSSGASAFKKKPVIIIVVGLTGSNLKYAKMQGNDEEDELEEEEDEDEHGDTLCGACGETTIQMNSGSAVIYVRGGSMGSDGDGDGDEECDEDGDRDHLCMKLGDHIDEFNKWILDLSNINIEIKDEDQALMLLTSFPSSYENFVERLLAHSGGSSRVKSKGGTSKLFCFICHSKGYLKRDYPIKKSSGSVEKDKHDHDSNSFDDEGNTYFEEALVDMHYQRDRKSKDIVNDGSNFIIEDVMYVLGLRRSLISLGTLEKEGIHGIQVDKRVWFEVKLLGAQENRKAEVFQVSNNDAAMAQRWMEDKQLEENTNTDYLVKEHKKVHPGIKVGANTTITGVPGQEVMIYGSDLLILLAYAPSMPPLLLLPLSMACDDSDGCVRTEEQLVEVNTTTTRAENDSLTDQNFYGGSKGNESSSDNPRERKRKTGAKNSMNHMVLSLAPKFTKLRALILSQDKPQLDDNAVETIANIVMIYMTSWLLGFVDVEKRHLTRPLRCLE